MRRRLLTGFILLALPSIAWAQAATTIIPENGGGNCNYQTGALGWDCIPILVANVVEFLIGGIGTLCLLQIIISGFELALGSTGIVNSDTWKTRLRNAIIGLLVSILAFAIVNLFVTAATA